MAFAVSELGPVFCGCLSAKIRWPMSIINSRPVNSRRIGNSNSIHLRLS